MRVLRVLSVAGVLALLGLLVWQVAHRNGANIAAEVDKGKVVPAPGLHLPRLDAPGKLDLASLRGNVGVVNFWQSTCLPCKEEAKTVLAAAHAWKDKGVDRRGRVVPTHVTGPASRAALDAGIERARESA